MVVGFLILGIIFGSLSAISGLVLGISWGAAVVLYASGGTLGVLFGAALQLGFARTAQTAVQGCHKSAPI